MEKTVFNKIVAGILLGSMVFSQPAVYADSPGTSVDGELIDADKSTNETSSDGLLTMDDDSSSNAESTELIDGDDANAGTLSEASNESETSLIDDSPIVITGWEENPIERESVIDNAPEDSYALSALFPDTVEAETDKGTTTVPIARWTAEDYEKAVGTYTLTAALEDGYTLGDGVAPLTNA